MAGVDSQDPLLGDSTCDSLLQELQQVWDEVGDYEERDKMLLQLEQECSDVYESKVGQSAKFREELLQALADNKVELSSLLSVLSEKTLVGIPDKASGTIKEQLADIVPALEKLKKLKEERIPEFSDVQLQIQKIGEEIDETMENVERQSVDESDLSSKKLDEFRVDLQKLQKEKLQQFATQLIDLWNLMDTPEEERSFFRDVTCNISASVDEVYHSWGPCLGSKCTG